jgi:hypothetical protein
MFDRERAAEDASVAQAVVRQPAVAHLGRAGAKRRESCSVEGRDCQSAGTDGTGRLGALLVSQHAQEWLAMQLRDARQVAADEDLTAKLAAALQARLLERPERPDELEKHRERRRASPSAGPRA